MDYTAIKAFMRTKNQVYLLVLLSASLLANGNITSPEKARLIDLNFDGHEDLQILDDAGVTGNVWYKTWLYNPTTCQYEYNQFLSGLSGIKVDSERKIISTYSRLGWCMEGVAHYKLENSSFRVIREIHTEIDSCNTPPGCSCFVRTFALENDSMKLEDKRVLDRDLFEII